jgi:hypothetical protein
VRVGARDVTGITGAERAEALLQREKLERRAHQRLLEAFQLVGGQHLHVDHFLQLFARVGKGAQQPQAAQQQAQNQTTDLIAFLIGLISGFVGLMRLDDVFCMFGENLDIGRAVDFGVAISDERVLDHPVA